VRVNMAAAANVLSAFMLHVVECALCSVYREFPLCVVMYVCMYVCHGYSLRQQINVLQFKASYDDAGHIVPRVTVLYVQCHCSGSCNSFTCICSCIIIIILKNSNNSP